MERAGWELQVGVLAAIPLNAFEPFSQVHVPGTIYPLTDSFQFALLWARETKATEYIFPGKNCGKWPEDLKGKLHEWGYGQVAKPQRGDLVLYCDDTGKLKNMAILTKDSKALRLLGTEVWIHPPGSVPNKEYGTQYVVWGKR